MIKRHHRLTAADGATSRRSLTVNVGGGGNWSCSCRNFIMLSPLQVAIKLILILLLEVGNQGKRIKTGRLSNEKFRISFTLLKSRLAVASSSFSNTSSLFLSSIPKISLNQRIILSSFIPRSSASKNNTKKAIRYIIYLCITSHS